MPRFTIRLYSDFGMAPQDKTKILFESDYLEKVINYIIEYFKHENYFNAVYFIDNKLNKSGYIGRDLTINCGENLFTFCELPNMLDNGPVNNKVTFDLKCPATVDPSDFYLDLIDFLSTELRKYTTVEIINEEILDNFKLENEIQHAEILAKTYQQRADLLRKQKVKEDFE